MKKFVPVAFLAVLLLSGCATALPDNAQSAADESQAAASQVALVTVVVPDVVGLTLDLARTKLNQADLKISATVANGKSIALERNWTVLSQSKPASGQADIGSTVDLVVGKENVESPEAPVPAPAPSVQVPPAQPVPAQPVPAQPAPKPVAVQPAPAPEPVPAAGTVSPGAFCSPAGSVGYSKKGVQMICTPDGKRNRWKAA